MGVLLRVAAVLVGAFLMSAFLRGVFRRPRVRAGVVMETREVASSEGFLNAADRCDACGARAYAAGWILTRAEKYLPLHFCAHHWREVDDPATAFEYFVDETHLV